MYDGKKKRQTNEAGKKPMEKKPTAHLLPLRGKNDSMRWNRVLVSVNIRPD